MSASPKRRLVLVTAAVAVVVVLLAAYFVPFRTAGGLSASECRTLSVAARIGGVAMDQERGLAYLAYFDLAGKSAGREPPGTIMLMDLNVTDPRVRAALVTDPPDFQPGALSLYAPKDGPRRLFVVDHENAVQIFEQSPSGAFERVKNVQDPQFANLIDVVPTGLETFYVVSRPHGWFGKWRLSVMSYDGAKAAPVPTQMKPVVLTQVPPEISGAYLNAKARKRLVVHERDEGIELEVCPLSGVKPSS